MTTNQGAIPVIKVHHSRLRVRRRTITPIVSGLKIVLPLLILGLAAIGATSVLADGAPYNGGFNNNAAGWSFAGINCGPYALFGHNANGSAWLGSGCTVWSSPVVVNSSFDTIVYLYSTNVTGTVRVYLKQAGGSVATLEYTIDQTLTWFALASQGNTGTGQTIQIGIEWLETGYVFVDDVAITGSNVVGVNPFGTPTPTPPPNGGWGPISSGGALGVVNVGTPTPYFNRAMFDNPVIPINTQGNSDISGVWNLTMTRRDLSACLPSQLSQVFTDLNVCLAVPLISIDEMSFAGIDLVPSLTMAVSVLFFFFIVRLLQTR